MSEMVERIAPEISLAVARVTRGVYLNPEQAEIVARAAIAAMREPTIDMVVAGTEQWLCEAAMEDRAEANWRAMLAAALQDPA